MTSVFDTPPPSLTDDQLHQLASSVFGLRGTVASLVSERDQNVRIDTDGGSFVMKIAHVAEDPVALSLQEAALEHLRRVDPELPVPHVMPPGTTVWQDHLVRVVTHLPGMPYALVPHSPELRRSLGALMGRVSRALQGFGHPGAHRPDFLWNLDHALAVEQWVSEVEGVDARTAVLAAFRRHRQRVLPLLPKLRAAVVHQDANDHNVLVAAEGMVSGLIDFGDMVHARQVNELAVTLAYALLDVDDVVAAATDVIAAYTAEFPLTDDELFVLFDLVATRLAMSIVISSHRSRDFADNEYLLISRAPAERLLRRLVAMRPQFLHFVARDAAGLVPVPGHDDVVDWLGSPACTPVSPLPFDLHRAGRIVVSLAKGAPLTAFADDAPGSWRWMQEQMAEHDAVVAIGRYDEDRACYEGDQFITDAPESRSVHLGIDLFVDEDTPVRAMLPGVVETVVDNAMPYDYGPTVILRHETGDAGPFWVLYGHLSRRTLTTVQPGDRVRAGQVVGYIGDHTVNGGWAPHVHIQIITDLMADPDHGPDGNFEGAGEPSRMGVWRAIAPDANLLLRLAPETFAPTPDPSALAARRHADLGPSLSVSYRRPLTILRGQGTWLVDHTGRALLDCVNNVAHVGHAHPHVVAAIARQAAVLNTNTRYLHPTILEYAERLAATFPDPLSVVYFTNSGSEANELALRIARTATDRHDVIAVDWGYHGNTNDLVEISAYKFNRKGGSGQPPHTHLAELPDPYRGRFGADGPAYAAGIATLPPAAAFIAESISGCGGQVVFPDGYLAAAYAHARAAGAVCIADEVQVGFGRVGSAMWAFELQGVVPDIVTLGKPIGNGHPLGAVVTTPELAAAFANGMEWFNTFGGNPVSCAAGMAVLDVIDGEGLQERALLTGTQLLEGFRALASQYDCIGDVRGHGMYLGIDLVSDRESKQPATALAADISNALRDRGVLVSTDGPADNVLKIKPPIVFGRAEADILLHELGEVLRTIG